MACTLEKNNSLKTMELSIKRTTEIIIIIIIIIFTVLVLLSSMIFKDILN
jgi:uncharacterized membrane protein affecting hemolysin expression